MVTRATVILFKPSGKYYTEEEWIVPENASGPQDMEYSPDWRRIDGGAVLVGTQEPWGYPNLFSSTPSQTEAEAAFDSLRQYDAAGLAGFGLPSQTDAPCYDRVGLRKQSE